MRHHSIINEHSILKAVRLFRYVKRVQLAVYFTGSPRPLKKLEKNLPAMERAGTLGSRWHKGEKVYFRPRKNQANGQPLDHDIPCVDILISLWRCRMQDSEIIPERAFRGYAIVPEYGIRYSQTRETMLIFEYSTRKNYEHGVMKSKLTRYRKCLPAMEASFEREITVLFVIDIARTRVQKFVTRMKPLLDEPIISGFSGKARYPFFFTDFRTFAAVPVGSALNAGIYFWHDGKEYPLSYD